MLSDPEKPHSDASAVARWRVLASYFSACIDLRNSMEFQKTDEAFARMDRGSIRYVLDSNLVRFFLDPVGESEWVNPFHDEKSNAYSKLAIITAEFIFSRHMEGQWGRPAAISPTHIEELSHHMDRLSRRLASRADAFDASSVDPEEPHLHEEAIRLAQSSGDLAASVQAFNAARTSQAKDPGDGLIREVYEAEMLDRIRRQELLLPLTLDEHATIEVVQPTKAAVDRWKTRIKTQRREASSLERNPLQDEADAETAEQIVQLNRNTAEQSLTPTRYVLITMDRHLFNAAVAWWQEEGKREMDFFPFRRLSQYIPALNTERLPNTLRERLPQGRPVGSVRKDLQMAFDSLLGMGLSRRRRIPLYIPEPRIDPPKGSLANEILTPLHWISDQWGGVEPIRDAISELWRKMTARANYLNPELLSRRDDAFDNFAEFMGNSPNLRQAAVAYLRQAVNKLDKFSIELGIAHSIAGEIMKRPQGHSAQSVRAMPVLREEFSAILGNERLYPLLDRIVLSGDLKPLSSVARRIDETELWRASFFAGCVAFWVGQWEGAAVYARRATEAVDTVERQAELAYFQVVTARFAALDLPNDTDLELSEALRRIRTELEKSADMVEVMVETSAKRDEFAVYRAGVEKALWSLSIAFVRGFQNDAGAPDVHEKVAEAGEQFRWVITELTDNPPGGAPDEALRTMQMECLIGQAGCLIFRERLLQSNVDLVEKTHLARQIETWVAANPEIAPSFYKVAVPLLTDGPSVAAAIGEILDEGHHMTWFDKTALVQLRALAASDSGR